MFYTKKRSDKMQLKISFTIPVGFKLILNSLHSATVAIDETQKLDVVMVCAIAPIRILEVSWWPSLFSFRYWLLDVPLS